MPAFYTLVLIWIYRDLWHQSGIATGLGWDTIDTHGPDLDFFASDLREGRFSLWNPYDKGGYPVFCDPVFDRYYPFNWPFAGWGALFGSSWWLVQIKVIAHHVAAGSSMHAFLRSRGLSIRAALVGGIALVASAPLLTHKASNILWPLVWVPIVWLAIDAALAKPSWRRGAGVAAAFTLCATAGSPPGLFYAMLLIVPYAIWRTGVALRGRVSREVIIAVAKCAGVAAILAGLVLAVTVLPTRDLVAVGSRDRFGTGRDFALALSLPLPAAIRGVMTRGAGLFEMYIGCAVFLLGLCAIVLRPRFDRGAAIVFASIAAFGVTLAAGATAGVLPVLVDHVPGFGLLRVPGRYKLLAAWSLAAAAGYGAASLEAAWGDVKLRTRAMICATCMVALASVFVIGWSMPPEPKNRATWCSIVAVVIAAGLVIAAVRAPRRWASFALSALALFVLFDAPCFTIVPPAALSAAEPRQVHDRDAELVERMSGVHDRYRLYDEFVLGERAGARLRIRDFRGYPAIDPLSQHRYVDILEYAKRDPAILTDFNVRWVLRRPHFRYGDGATYVRMPSPGFESRGGELWEAAKPAPIVAWYGAGRVVDDPKQVLAVVRGLQDPDGSRRRVVVEPDAAIPPGYTSAEPDLRIGSISKYEPDEIAFEIEAPRAGLVVLNEIMFPGWTVRVDGELSPAVRANYLLRAVVVPPGVHQITWRFEPAHWRILVAGYVIALAIMLVAAFAPRRRSAP
ncbi:MAG: hypothetical protein JWO36_3806 [Myxococcales bacterium]|nr:hypothetical protein [Myxococcales bacterium]